MPALVAGIHVFLVCWCKDVDGWDKPGHDTEKQLSPSITQILFPLLKPCLFICERQRIQIVWHGRCIIHPFAQRRTAVDDIDRRSPMLVLVSEIAPERIVGVQAPDSLESECLDAPGLEGVVLVVGTFGVDLHPVAKLTDVFMKRGLEPAFAQTAAIEPPRSKRVHFLHDG